MKLPKEYTIIAITIQNLINDGWKLSVNENTGIINKAINDDEVKNFIDEKEFKDWVLGKSLDY